MQRQFGILKHRYLIQSCFVRLARCAFRRLKLLISSAKALLLAGALYRDRPLTLRSLGKQRFLLSNVSRPRGLHVTDIIIRKAWFSSLWLFSVFYWLRNLRGASGLGTRDV